jgi:thiol-disulfide isomerase/thioredoxin/outer membrane lipoprotein-sorting protein
MSPCLRGLCSFVLLSSTLAVPGLAQTSSQEPIVGTWINADPQTNEYTRVVVRAEQGKLIAHVFGACEPIDCDSSETLELKDGIQSAHSQLESFTTWMQFIPQPDGRLMLASRTESDRYKPTSPIKTSVEFFNRQTRHMDSPEEEAARTLAALTSETYRNLKSAKFVSAVRTTTTSATAEWRTSRTVTVLYSAPNHMRIDTLGDTEESSRIDDGKTEWLVFPKSNEYRSNPQSVGLSDRLRYTNLDQLRGTPHITGHPLLDGVQCTILHLDRERGAQQDLWVDDTSHMIIKDVLNIPAGEPGRNSRVDEQRFTIALANPVLDSGTFSYDPSTTGARNRVELEQQAPISMVGALAPDFTLRDLDNRQVRLADLRGSVVVLDFWATWCGYCIEALPTMELLHRGEASKGVRVLAIDAEEPELARSYLSKAGYSLPSLVDSHDAVSTSYHVSSLPCTVVIDRKGYVAYYGEAQQLKLKEVLQKLDAW